MKFILLFVVIVLALLILPFVFLPEKSKTVPPSNEGNPWQVEKLPENLSRVFGIDVGRATLSQVRARLGNDIEVAMLVAPGERGSVEAYYSDFKAGMVNGKLVLNIRTTLEEREAMLARAQKAEYMKGTTRRITLDPADLLRLEAYIVSAATFIPSAQLDEEIILQRFGKPSERIRSNENTEHFLYPEIGLDLQLNNKGKEVLQYVPPRDFATLREPLLQAGTP